MTRPLPQVRSRATWKGEKQLSCTPDLGPRWGAGGGVQASQDVTTEWLTLRSLEGSLGDTGLQVVQPLPQGCRWFQLLPPGREAGPGALTLPGCGPGSGDPELDLQTVSGQ